MQTIPANRILNAIEGRDLESILHDGRIIVLLGLRPLMTIPALPTPQISIGADNIVSVFTGNELAVRIEPAAVLEDDDDPAHDAGNIAGALACLFEFAA